ncbi:MAG: glycosyltransferase [Bacteroidota bacterium]
MGFVELYSLIMLLFLVMYAVIIIAFTIGLKRVQSRTNSGTHISFVSVIIPVRNERNHIMRVLEEMRCQDFPGSQMQVIVADDFSEDYTMDFASQFANQFPVFPLVLVPSDYTEGAKSGKKSAIERAVRLANGEILLFTDADTFHGPCWVTSMVAAFKYSSLQMALGPVVFSNTKNILQKIQSLEFIGLMATTAGSAGLGYPVMCNGANLAYRRNAFFEAGGFEGNLQYSSGDDQFIMSSIRKRYGGKAITFNYDPLAVVSTEPEQTLIGFIHQRMRWVSKIPGYRDRAMILTGLVTYLLHSLLMTGIFLGFFFPRLFFLSLLMWLVKILLEHTMVKIMMLFFGKQELHGYYFIAQTFQLVYVPLIGILGLIMPHRWKGRSGVR